MRCAPITRTRRSFRPSERSTTVHRGAVPSQEQYGRRLASVIGRLPVPGAGRVRCAERCLHGVAQNSGIDALAAFEVTQKLSRGLNDSRSDNRGGTDRQRHCGAAHKRFSHGRFSREELEWVEPPGALLTAAAQNPSRPPSSSEPASNKNGTGAKRRPPPSTVSLILSATPSHSAASSCGRSSALTSRFSSSERNSGSAATSLSCSAGTEATSTRCSGSGSQPEPSRRRSASLVVAEASAKIGIDAVVRGARGAQRPGGSAKQQSSLWHESSLSRSGGM